MERCYRFLEVRSDSWRRSLFLKGRNMAVGQLVATMRANGWNVDEAAYQFELPVEQVVEALDYYQAHHNLIDRELRAEADHARARDVLRVSAGEV